MSITSPALPGNEVIRLLVVDDNEADRTIIEEYLSEIHDFKYEIFGVGSLREAEKTLSLYPFDAVVLDYQLGDGCGLDFIRQTQHLHRAPVVLLTGYRSRELDRIALEAGASDLLYKNELQPSLLERSIRYSLERFKALEMQRKCQEELEKSNNQLRDAKAQIEVLGANSVKLAEYLASASGSGTKMYADRVSASPHEGWEGFASTCRLGIWRVAPDGRTRSANVAMEAFLGMTEAQLVGSGRSFASYFAERDREQAKRELMIWAHGVSSSLEAELAPTVPAAPPRRVVVCGAPLKGDDGRITAILMSVVDITDRRQTEASMQSMAVTDPLTGALNRLAFTQYFPQLLANADRTGRCVATLYTDLDGFKEINDTLGHQAGDQVLQHVSNVIRKCTRKSDLVARIGGDEFVVALTNLDTPSSSGLVAGQILSTLREPFHVEATRLNLNASIGISIFPIDSMDPDVLLRYADLALYRQKGAQGGGFSFFDVEAGAVSTNGTAPSLPHAS